MKRRIFTALILTFGMIMLTLFSGCSLLNKIPEQYTEGIKYDKDYPDDALEIYDNAIVYDSRSQFGDIVLTCGTEDDIDDIIDFYHDFFDDNEIVLDKETEDKDEYFASGISEEYSFKIQVEEASGEYIEDLFEYIIMLSVSELSDEELAALQATPTPEPTPFVTIAPPQISDEPIYDEAPMTYFPEGSYQLLALYNNDEIYDMRVNLQIYDSVSGRMYYYDYYADERWMDDFTYTVSNGVLVMDLNNGTHLEYNAYYEEGYLHLVNEYADTYYYDWEYYNTTELNTGYFTAFGDWVYYEPSTGYVETISFWPNGDGYMYNWGGSGVDSYIGWDYDYATGNVTIYDDTGAELVYGLLHNGEVFELYQSNGSVFFYDRLTPDLLSTLSLEYATEEGLEDWTLNFYSDGTVYSDRTVSGYNTSEEGYWYIDGSDGSLNMYLGEEYIAYDYHYNLSGFILSDYTYSNYYEFVEVG